jgi:mRNA-degrading endonuclease RelE of RelBE toxin-antitoxin system
LSSGPAAVRLSADEGVLHIIRTEVASADSADRRLQIVSRIEALASGTGQRGDVQRLAGSDLFRLRVGDYRVLFAVDTVNQILRVELIRTRGDVYKR